MTTMEARKAYLEIKYDSADISKHIESYVLGWTFTDNLSGQADDLQLTLQDRDQLWIKDWLPQQGATLKANIVRNNWEYWNQVERSVLGLFDIDEIEVSGSPSVVTIKAISVPLSSSLNGQRKNKAWEKAKLAVILKDIASRNGLKLFYESSENPEYDRIEQTEQTDLEFLTKLCNDAGLCLKVSNNSIVIFDEEKYEQAAPVTTIEKGKSLIKNYSGRTTLTGVYKSCRVDYQDGNSKKKITATFTPKTPPKTERILVINEQVSSIAEAQRLAKKRLRQENKNAQTMSFTLVGDLRLFAGRTVQIKGFGSFDGKYLITQAAHSQQNGYETKIEIRKCLEGY